MSDEIQQSRAAARKPRDAEAIFRLKFANEPSLIKQGFRAPDILTHCVGLVVPCGV